MNIESRPHGPFGVVAVGRWRPEYRHHVVADVLVDVPTILTDGGIRDGEEFVEQSVGVFRIALPGQLCEPRDVREQDRYLPAFPGRGWGVNGLGRRA